MLIIIDLSEGGETIVGVADKEEQLLAEEEAKRREAYLKWVRRNQVVLPQVVPVEPNRQ